MAEGAALEMRCAGNRTEGSNPSRSVSCLDIRIAVGRQRDVRRAQLAKWKADRTGFIEQILFSCATFREMR